MTERTRGIRPDYKVLNSTGKVSLKNTGIQRRHGGGEDSSTKASLAEGTMSSAEIDNDGIPGLKDEESSQERQGSKSRVKTGENQAVFMQLASQAAALSDDIDDFMDENSIDDAAGSIVELDSIISQVEKLRSMYRAKHKELETLMGVSYQDEIGPALELNEAG